MILLSFSYLSGTAEDNAFSALTVQERKPYDVENSSSSDNAAAVSFFEIIIQ
jgi:hypothetical protein